MQPLPEIEDEFDAGFSAEDEFTPVDPEVPQEVLEGLAAIDAEAPATELDGRTAEPSPEAPEAELTGFADELGGSTTSIPAYTAAPNPVHELQAQAEAALVASVPRIAINIFCQSQDTTDTAERVVRDRRLSRASAVIRSGGLAAAVEHYQGEPTPSLVIVESNEPRDELLGLLDRLAEVCDPGTKVIVIGAANDIALYRELMRKGVSEYLTPPVQPLQLISAITTLYNDPATPFVGRQVAFVGAKGGVGASTLAHNFSYALSERFQTNTVLADFDLAFGTAGLDFNQDPLQGVANALHQPDRLDPVLLERMMARCTERLSLFAAPGTIDDDYDIPADAFEEVASKIRTTAPFIVLDLPHLWSGWVRKMLLTSDDVVVVAAPDLASLRNAKNLVDLMRQNRPNDAPPRLVLNQVGIQGRPEIPVKDFGEALGLQPALVLPFDPKLFGKAANNGQMIQEVGPGSRAAEGLDYLAELISRREPAPVAKRGGLASLFKFK
jgi:pilus assembly protein CpaE